jgi:hypothetical protein
MNPNPTVLTDLPTGLSNLMGAYDTAHWQTVVAEIKPGIGVLQRGSVLATGSGGDVGKLVPLTAGTEAQAYGVLLDPSIDTSVAYSDGSVTGSVAKAGSSRGPALIVPTGVDAGLIASRFAAAGSSSRERSPFLPLLLPWRESSQQRQRRSVVVESKKREALAIERLGAIDRLFKIFHLNRITRARLRSLRGDYHPMPRW